MDPINLIFGLAVLILSVVVHEVSHGYAAYALGDRTAKNLGRLTFNPIKHLDLWGSFIVPIALILLNAGIIFGWAKPVPYNPYNLRDQKWGSAKVAAAGPLANIVIALFFTLVLRVAPAGIFSPLAVQALGLIVYINILLALFNLVPIPPLDGSKILAAFLPYRWERGLMMFEQYGIIIVLLFLFLFLRPLFLLIDFVFQLLVGDSILRFL